MSTREYAEHAFEAYNSGDVDAFMEVYADDAVLSYPGVPGGTIRGRQAIRQNWADQRASFPDGHITSEVLVVEGDTAADEFTYSGTNTGPMAMPDGSTLPATGRHIEMKGMQLLQLRDGKVIRHDLFLDSAVMAAQMGMAQPPFASAAP